MKPDNEYITYCTLSSAETVEKSIVRYIVEYVPNCSPYVSVPFRK